MKADLYIEPRVRSLKQYLGDIENGIVQIPAFQRDYVWERDDIKSLFDSIKNRFPIGSVLFWKPDTKIGENKNKIGSYTIQRSGRETIYILDGFQRLSTLFGCLINPYKSNLVRDDEEWKKFFNVFYDLEEETFLYLRPSSLNLPYQIPVYTLMNSSDFRQYARKEFEKIPDEKKIDEYYDRADKLSRVFLDYQIASIDISNANIEEAVEIFSRINSKGQDISFDWMANAFSSKNGFRFGDEIDNLIEEIKQFNFDKIDRNVIFRCVQSSFGKLYIDNPNIEALAKRKDFATVTKSTLPKIKEAIKFLFEELLVIDSKLLPYNMQLIFVMDFFKAHENPSEEQKAKLKHWFWVTTYANYFTIYSLSNQRRAYQQFQQFLRGLTDDPIFNDKPELQFSVPEFPEKVTMGSVRAKALTLFLLNHANDFKQVNSDNVEGFKLRKLFAESSVAENYIPIVEFYTNNDVQYPTYSIAATDLFGNAIGNSSNFVFKAKDLSFWLSDPMIEKYTPYLLTKEMQFCSKPEVLVIRKQLIKYHEGKFVEKLGLEYEDLDLRLGWHNPLPW